MDGTRTALALCPAFGEEVLVIEMSFPPLYYTLSFDMFGLPWRAMSAYVPHVFRVAPGSTG
jgi:hypothetical protein